MVKRLVQDPTGKKSPQWQSWNSDPRSLDFCTVLYILNVLPLRQPTSSKEVLCAGQYVKQLLLNKKKKTELIVAPWP